MPPSCRRRCRRRRGRSRRRPPFRSLHSFSKRLPTWAEWTRRQDVEVWAGAVGAESDGGILGANAKGNRIAGARGIHKLAGDVGEGNKAMTSDESSHTNEIKQNMGAWEDHYINKQRNATMAARKPPHTKQGNRKVGRYEGQKAKQRRKGVTDVCGAACCGEGAERRKIQHAYKTHNYSSKRFTIRNARLVTCCTYQPLQKQYN